MGNFQADIQIVSRILAVPTIFEVICKTTGMGFAAVARVTEDRWIACSVLDQIDFGLKPGGELKVETTICHEIRQHGEAVVIDNVAEDVVWRKHATPALYGFQSYISVPIMLEDGSFFGTLCAIDPRPVTLNKPETIGMFRLFAELIARNLDVSRRMAAAEAVLADERAALKKTEYSLQASERSNEALQRFAAIASHDLHEPLREISIFTRLLADHYRGQIDSEAQQYFDFVQAGAARMDRLISGLMAFSQIDALDTTRHEEADAEVALDEALLNLRMFMQEAEAVVTHDPLPKVSGNQSQLTQVFQNLLSNAVKYRREAPPRIHVAATRTFQTWIFSVSDNGVGIEPKDRLKIFDVFARLHGREIAGAGLGLAFCAKVIELHGGRIWVEANHATPTGSIFYFSLPIT